MPVLRLCHRGRRQPLTYGSDGSARVLALVAAAALAVATTLPAVAGYPHLTVPMGDVTGLPVGLSFIGPAWSEKLLLNEEREPDLTLGTTFI